MKRWAIVTGAAGGMGEAITLRLLREGYGVLALVHPDHDVPVRLPPSGPDFAVMRLDLRDAHVGSQVAGALPALLGEDGTVYGLVNVAGVSTGSSIEDISDDHWQASIDVNASAPMRLCRSLVPFMVRAGIGSIVNIASPVALIGARKVSYAASKAALLGLSVAMARGLGRHGVRVNSVLPGATITGMTRDWAPEKIEQVARNNFLGRLCTPEDIAGVVAFLLGPDSAYITGATLDVTAGGLYGAH